MLFFRMSFDAGSLKAFIDVKQFTTAAMGQPEMRSSIEQILHEGESTKTLGSGALENSKSRIWRTANTAATQEARSS